MHRPDLESKFLGSMLGSGIGDAIGEMAFECPDRAKLTSVLEEIPVLRYTDDTAMALGIAETLGQVRKIDVQRLGDVFRRNYDAEPWRGYAPGPPMIFQIVASQGIPYPEAAARLFGGAGSFGNGAAMRVSPVGLFYHDSRLLYDEACASARVTHTHPVGMDGAATLAFAVGEAVKIDPDHPFPTDRFLNSLVRFPKTQQMREKMERLAELVSESSDAEPAANALGRSVAVNESLPFAFYAFLRYPMSFEDCLFCAILNGGDRDTLGAMACALSGAYLGVDAVPLLWREKLENRELIENLARKLL